MGRERREEAAAERRAGEASGEAVRGGEEAGGGAEGAPGGGARSRSEAGRGVVPEPAGPAQEQAGGGGLPQAQGRPRSHHPRKVPPRERGITPATSTTSIAIHFCWLICSRISSH